MAFNDLGLGYDTFKGAFKRTPILEFTTQPRDTSATANVYVCTSSEDVDEKLGISASLGVKSGAVDVSGKLDFSKDLSKKMDAVTILVRVNHVFGQEVKDAKLKQKYATAKDLLAAGGDSYVRYVEAGVQYFAAYQFVTVSTTQKQTLQAQAKAKFGKGVTVTGSLGVDLSNLATSSNTTWSFTQYITGATETLPDQNNAITFAMELTGKPVSNPTLIYAETESYSAIDGSLPGFDNIDKWLSAYKEPGYYDYSLQSMQVRAETIRARVEAVQLLYSFYQQEDLDPTLPQCLNELQRAKGTIKAWRDGFNGGADLPKKPEIDVSWFKMPSAAFTFTSGQFHGRNRGADFNDVDEEMVFAFMYPKTWKCKGSSALDNMVTVFGKRELPNLYDLEKETIVEKQHGGKGGVDILQNAAFDPAEISYTSSWLSDSSDGSWNDCVGSFEVKKWATGDLSYKWGDVATPKWHGDMVLPGTRFMGFSGRAADAIDALQPVYVQFHPAKWQAMK